MNNMKTSKQTRSIVRSIASLATTLLLATACSNELADSDRNPQEQPGEAGRLITVTATQGSRPQTRLGYEDPDDNTKPIVVTWAERDKFFVGKDWAEFADDEASISEATDYFSPFTLKEGSEGSKSADFTGDLPTGVVAGDQLYGIYGDGKRCVVLGGEGKEVIVFNYVSQIQSANNNKDHLSGADFMVATTTYETDKQPDFNFTHLGAMIKFTLTLPTADLTVKQLTLTTTDGSTPFSTVVQWDKGALAFSASMASYSMATLYLGNFTGGVQTGIALGDTKTLTAYMMVAPTALSSVTIADKVLQLQMTDADGAIYSTTLKGADIEQGKYYTVTATMKSNKWDGTYPVANADAKFSGGDGTQATPFLLASPEDFAQFKTNESDDYSRGKYFRLVADIDLDNKLWIPIDIFAGNFDGGQHTISNLNVNVSSGNGGLFSKLNEATITNLHVNGHVVISIGELKVYAGGICGRTDTKYSGSTTISGCSFSGSVTGSRVGGICGFNQTKLTIIACCNKGTISGNFQAGGILGRDTSSGSTNITACYNTGEITLRSPDSTPGAIVSFSLNYGKTQITACYNTYTHAQLTNTGYSIANDSYAVAANADEENEWKATLFSADAWPSTITNAAWTTSADAPGSENQYWKSLGGWNDGTPEYPKLWWEK